MYGLLHFLKQYKYDWLQIASLHDSCQLHFFRKRCNTMRNPFLRIFFQHYRKFPMKGKPKVNSTIYCLQTHTRFIALKLSSKRTLVILGFCHPHAVWLSLNYSLNLSEFYQRPVHNSVTCVQQTVTINLWPVTRTCAVTLVIL